MKGRDPIFQIKKIKPRSTEDEFAYMFYKDLMSFEEGKYDGDRWEDDERGLPTLKDVVLGL